VSAEPTELADERVYLAGARAALARMRQQTLATEARGGDAIAAEYLAATLHRRAESLRDDPTGTLFFGRIDQPDPQAGAERWYIGRRHVADQHGDPLVVDWRADVSTAFYRASRAEPMGVTLRRRFGVDRGELTAYEDEHLSDPAEVTGDSRIVASEIERPRVGPMRDIVATIQPEQDEIVRADVATTVCVQGAPGTGKTAVGLHRAAWLLYAFRDRLSRTGVLVIGPNRAFLDHIGAVLPALGEVRVTHTTIEELLESVRVRAVDDSDVAVLKGDPRLAEVLRRAVWSRVREPTEALVVPRGSRKWRVPAHEVRDIVAELRTRGIRYDAARQMLARRLAHAVLLQMERSGDSPDDRVQDAVARSTPVTRYAKSLWPQLDPRHVLFDLLSDPVELARHADGLLDPRERELLLWTQPPRTRGAARWTSADTVLLDEIAALLNRPTSLGHVVLDEAQDLSPMQLRAVGRRCATGSATVLGDIGQGTTPWATDSWAESMTHLCKPEGHLEVLDRVFRVPAAVIEYAARLLPRMAPGLGAPVSVRENPGRLEVRAVGEERLLESLVEVVRKACGEPGSVGVILADDQVPKASTALTAAGLAHLVLGLDHGDTSEHPHQVLVVPARVAKGLEFDRVVVLEPAAIAEAEPDERTGLRRLYVILTRAVTELTVLHTRELPAELADSPDASTAPTHATA
jgi:DNA helicase IV